MATGRTIVTDRPRQGEASRPVSMSAGLQLLDFRPPCHLNREFAGGFP